MQITTEQLKYSFTLTPNHAQSTLLTLLGQEPVHGLYVSDKVMRSKLFYIGIHLDNLGQLFNLGTGSMQLLFPCDTVADFLYWYYITFDKKTIGSLEQYEFDPLYLKALVIEGNPLKIEYFSK